MTLNALLFVSYLLRHGQTHPSDFLQQVCVKDRRVSDRAIFSVVTSSPGVVSFFNNMQNMGGVKYKCSECGL